MDLASGQPLVEAFTEENCLAPTLVDDHGDIFHCGKCKQNFNTLLDFLTHKREHATCVSECTLTKRTQHEVQLVTLSQPSNEIWLLNDETVTECSNIIIASEENTNGVVMSRNAPLNAEQHNREGFTNSVLSMNVNHTDSPCDYSTTKNSENQSQDSINSSNILACSICQRLFKKQFDLFLHLRSHTGEKPFQCIVCGRTFAHKSNLKKHMSSHKVWPDGLSKMLPQDLANGTEYLCPYCEKRFESYVSLRTHLKEHRHQKVYKCIQKKCVAMFVDLDSLISHINIMHPLIEYHCHICLQIFTSLKEISTHQQTHKQNTKQSKKSFYCIYCRAKFKKHDHLAHHLAIANHVNRCPQCSKTFVAEKALRRHLMSHNASKMCRCDICGSTFRSKQYLSSHMLTHNKEKKFTCTICNIKFARKDILMRHIKIHQPNKKKPCPFRNHLGCLMEFTRTDKLNLHVKTHTDKLDSKRKIRKENKAIENETQSTIEIIIVPMADAPCLSSTKI